MTENLVVNPDLRYPVGRFSAPTVNIADLAHVEIVRQLPERFKAAVNGLNDHQIDTPYRDGGWTVRQLVHHVADSHANAYIRFKLALTEDWPIIKPYDEAAWAKLPDSSLPVQVSLDLLTLIHQRWVTLLESLSEEEYRRGYVHPAMVENGGRQPLSQVLALYAWHSRHHTAHITHLRNRMGW
jgi:uncharacterized damage-inducible protein DinB